MGAATVPASTPESMRQQLQRHQLAMSGHALECRLCAEDACNDLLPSSCAFVPLHCPGCRACPCYHARSVEDTQKELPHNLFEQVLLGAHSGKMALTLGRCRWLYRGVLGEVAWPELPGLRVDTWVTTGTLVSHNYDSLIAKVMTHAETRADAIVAMQKALQKSRVKGIPTNQQLLEAALVFDEFLTGRYDTTMLQRLPLEKSFVEVCHTHL